MVEVQIRWADLSEAHVGLDDVLDTTERSRLAGLDAPADRARFLVGVWLLRGAAGQALGLPPAEVAIDRTCPDCGGPHGPPRVAGGPHVSVSHSGVLVVVALCHEAPVGVDVQRITDLTEQDPVSWTRRESHFKALGPSTGLTGSSTLGLEAPRPGYAAALTVATTGPARVHIVAASDLG